VSSKLTEPKIYVLRLGHRQIRDKRATAHLFLVARAFGADKIIYAGQKDGRLEDTARKVVGTWGGTFEVEYEEDWRKILENWKADDGEIVHLTMYGLPIQDVINLIRDSSKDKIIVVGGAKVPSEVFKLADWNVSVTFQPHSEISALSVFLHELFQGKELSKTFQDSEIEIVPQARGKKVIRKETRNRCSLKQEI